MIDFFLQQKYTDRNIACYLEHMFRIIQVDPMRLHFVDESHFVSSSLYRQLAVGPINKRVLVCRANRSDGERLTCTCITSIRTDQCTTWVTATRGANTAVNFIENILDAVEEGFIRAGSIIILDNAKVSCAQ